MNLKFPYTLFLFAALLMQMAACSAPAEHGQHEQKGLQFIPGKVISRVTCLNDSTLSYALFLPKNYDPSRRYPLIIAFDPHAAGKLPVDLLSEGAESNGYIIAGSNNSKNGISFEITSSIYDVMRHDILQRLSVDTNRIYTAGFSGGSRVAAFVALARGGISGVIGCSAGFPQVEKPSVRRFSYLGVVGDADFNFSEMKALDKALEGAGFVHHLLVFNGTHAWPPASLIPSLYTWLELDAMRQKLKLADANYITRISEKYHRQVDSLHHKNDIEGEYAKCLEAIQFLNGVSDVRSFLTQASHLSLTAEIKSKGEEDERLAQKETRLQQYYAGAMGPQDEKWWNTEVKRLNGSTGKESSLAERTMFNRVLNYLSLAAYMQASSALKAGERERAGYFLRIYALVDPANAEAPYLAACWLAGQGKDDEALKSLSKAVDLGFTDLKRAESDPAFTKFKIKPEYKAIISRLRNKK